MKIGDLVTYKQRPDLQVFPCPWRRLGIVVGAAPGRLKESSKEIEVYWWGSENIVAWREEELELAR